MIVRINEAVFFSESVICASVNFFKAYGRSDEDRWTVTCDIAIKGYAKPHKVNIGTFDTRELAISCLNEIVAEVKGASFKELEPANVKP